jgi:calcium-dependent protein kinase
VAVKTIAKHDALGLWSKTNRWQHDVRRSRSSPRDAEGEMSQQVVKKRTPRLDEVDVLLSLRDSPNVVQLLDVYETHQEVQLVLEYCEGGDLFDCIKRRKQMEAEPEMIGSVPPIRGSFTELETATVAKTLLTVLQNLHSRNIVHRDIKPENILLMHDDEFMDQLGAVKLTDFGLARLLRDDNNNETSSSNLLSHDLQLRHQRSRAYSCVGSDYYTAPEVHLGLGYDTPVDVYSLGVTLYVLLCGTPPSLTSLFKSDDLNFSDGDSSEESCHASDCSSSSDLFPSELQISSLAQDLISKMIHPDPVKRITASEALEHEWISSLSVQEDTETMTRVTSRLSLSSSRETSRPRTMSRRESESFFHIGPVVPMPSIPPSNSPVPMDAPPVQKISPVSLTLADVCNKLAPLVNELQQQRKRRRTHSRGNNKKVCADLDPQHTPNAFGHNRIERRFNSPNLIHGPFLPQQSTSPA